MSRSMKKGPYVDEKLAEKVAKLEHTRAQHANRSRPWARACTVVPDFVGHTFMVHNGKMHIKVYVTEDFVGHKLGEFAPSRIFKGHSGVGSSSQGCSSGSSGSGSTSSSGWRQEVSLGQQRTD